MSCECLGTTAGKRHDLAKVLEGSEFPESAHHTTILLFIEISSSQFCRFKRIDLYVLGYINQLGR